jgi:hypothetical protein
MRSPRSAAVLRPSFGLSGLERGSPRVTGKAPPTGVRVGCGESLGWERGARTGPRRLLSAGRDGREFRSRRRGCVWRRRPLSEHLDGPVAIASHGVPVDHLDAEIPANEADLVDHAGAATLHLNPAAPGIEQAVKGTYSSLHRSSPSARSYARAAAWDWNCSALTSAT